MSTPGVEPGLSRPQRDVLTTRRCGPCHRWCALFALGRKLLLTLDIVIACSFQAVAMGVFCFYAAVCVGLGATSRRQPLLPPDKPPPHAASLKVVTEKPCTVSTHSPAEALRMCYFFHWTLIQSLYPFRNPPFAASQHSCRCPKFRHRDSNPGRSGESRVS